jgi:plasmid stabilization system protein ParE
VNWTDTGKSALKSVYEFHSEYSETLADKLVTELVDRADAIVFSKQYQVDEINPKYRRIIVGDYKVLYNEKNNIIEIMDVICTLQSPEILKNK